MTVAAKVEKRRTAIQSNAGELTQEVEIKAPVRTVFQAVATPQGLGKWWSYYLTGPDPDTGEVHLKWPQSGHHARLRLSEMREPSLAAWLLIEHYPFEEVANSTLRFLLEPTEADSTKLTLEIPGLTPEKECYSPYSGAWKYLLGQVKNLVEQGYP